MTKNARFITLVVFVLFLGLTWGTASSHYSFFPYKQLRSIKRAFSPELAFNPYHYDRISIFNTFQSSANIVMLGDSLTDFGEWNAMFPGKSIVNRGISGDRTDGILKRLNEVLSIGASDVFIMIGFNDLNAGVDPSKVITNYKNILLELTNENIHVYIQSILCVNAADNPVNKLISQVNQQLNLIAQNNHNVTYIDLNAKLSTSGKLNDQFTTDGIHLNGKGYEVWRDTLHLFID